MRQKYEDGDGDWDEDEAEDGDNVLGRGWTIGHGDDDFWRRLVHMRMVTKRLVKRESSQLPTSVP